MLVAKNIKNYARIVYFNKKTDILLLNTQLIGGYNKNCHVYFKHGNF